MSQPRIAPLNPPYADAVATALQKMTPPNAPAEPLLLFRVLAQHLDLTSRMRPLAAGLLGHGELPAQAREIVILRTCARCGAEYEWGVHVAGFAKAVGLTQEQIAATVHGHADSDVWSAEQSTLIRMVDELHADANLTPATWDALSVHWSPAQIVELLVLAGWYHAISYVANVSGIPSEVWAARFPEA